MNPFEHPYWKTQLPRNKAEAAQAIAKVGQDEFEAQLLKISKAIELEREDPFYGGVQFKHWEDTDNVLKVADEILISGGNRSGKTEYCARKAVEMMLEIPNSRVWCFHTTHQSSLQVQQPVVYKYIPAHLRNQRVKRGTIANISYSQKNGFSDNTFVFPNGSQCTFMHYSQKPDVWEGAELDFCWMDELVPWHIVETIRYRLVTRQGKLLVSFTPIEGYSLTVKNILAGHQVTEWAKSELLPGQNIIDGPRGKMPYIARCAKPRSWSIWYHTKWNPYNNYEELKKKLNGSSSHDIKIRAYGYAEAAVGNRFPRFDDIHMVDPQEIPEGGFNVFVMDPAGSRNWFMIWAKIVDGKVYIYREWPDWRMGEWAIPGDKPDGRPGPAQRAGAGQSCRAYVSMIEEIEGRDEQIFLRLIDSRAAGATSAGSGLTVLEELEAAGMYFATASGKQIEEGVGLINDLLYFDKGQPAEGVNIPRLYVSKECKNVEYAVREWTGADKLSGACKDPVDCLRYLALEDPLNISPQRLATSGGGSY